MFSFSHRIGRRNIKPISIFGRIFELEDRSEDRPSGSPARLVGGGPKKKKKWSSSFFRPKNRRWGLLRSSGSEDGDGGLFALRSRNIEETPIFEEPSHIFEEVAPPVFHPISGPLFAAEDWRWKRFFDLRGRRSKIEDAGSSIIAYENRW